ncbi:MAG: hypothetical protein FWG10_06285 [Eubacteriaceae bacterium]|nr:hypothetical protein [Eubacteriaceae bacterium]
MKADTTFPDILDREFEGRGPRAVLLTGITYIINGKTPRCHMCAIIGGRAKELPAWRPVGSLEIDFVL